jgi:hypothetical protein
MQELLSEITSDKKIRSKTLGYFEGRINGLFHQVLLRLLRVMEQREDFSKRKLAFRLGKKPEQITRWFSNPSNLTLGTISALCLGAGYEVRGLIVAEITTGKIEQLPNTFVPPVVATPWDQRSNTRSATGASGFIEGSRISDAA